MKNPHPDWPFRWDSTVGGWDVVIKVPEEKAAQLVITTRLVKQRGITTSGDLYSFACEMLEKYGREKVHAGH